MDYHQPSISIIIPTYFEERLLANLLTQFDANVKQKYNLEVIVSDGGSTDSTLEIAELYADKVVTHDTDERQNISQGRNCGAAVADGKVLVFINADCMPEDVDVMLSEVVAWMQTDKSDAIACTVAPMPDEVILRDRIFYSLHNRYVHILNLIGTGMGRGECQIVRTDVFRRIGGYNDKLAAGEDFDLYRRIRKSGYHITFSKKIVIQESPRRFRKYGYLKTLLFWTLNSLSVIFCDKSASKEWEPIR